MKRLVCGLVLMPLFGMLVSVHAQDQPDPNGTWVWTANFRGNSAERVLTLRLEDGVLSGTVTGRNGNETPVSDAVFEAGKVSFNVVRRFNDREVTMYYAGTIEGDTLTGEIRSTFNGEERTREWVATRRAD